MSDSSRRTTLEALQAVDAALRAGQRERALAIAANACREGAEHFALLTFAAQRDLSRGNPDLAITLAEKASALSPGNLEVLNTLGVAYAAAGRYREALRVFDAALREQPLAWPVRFNKAAAFDELQEFENARVEFERVLETQPRHADALARLASLAVQRGDVAEGRRRAKEALAIDPSQIWAELTLAAADNEDGEYEAALARIEGRSFHSDANAKARSVSLSLVGDALDGLGRTGEAFRSYLSAKETLLAPNGPATVHVGGETAAGLVARLTSYFEHVPVGAWHAENASDSRSPAHVFIVGFPRSGTTLLEQILAGHPDAEVMGERSCLIAAQESFTMPADGLDLLAALGDDKFAPWRDDYWRRVGEEGFRTDCRVFVDKMLFYCVFLCLIAKLFPRAKILFLVRDPRDVVLSCLRRRLVMTDQTRELASLDAAANHYGAVMSLCDIYRRTLGLQICDVRYENLVGSFDDETRRICTFLDLQWQPGLRDFPALAAKRPAGTPSGPQLARGLIAGAQGQWRRYGAELAPALPRLMPWIERFGYSKD